MAFDVFIGFNGNCREAIDFYAKVFRSQVEGLLTYGDMPAGDDYTPSEEEKNLITPIFGGRPMFYDAPFKLSDGNRIAPTLSTKDMDEIRRVFDELKVGGEVEMELQEAFWSDLFGIVIDKFGITWQLLHDSGKY